MEREIVVSGREIIISFLSLMGVIVTAYLGYLGQFKKRITAEGRADQSDHELRFQADALGFSEFITEWADIEAEVKAMMADTVIDRFIIFRAWNGSFDPKYTTSVFQIRHEGQIPITYIHYEMDHDYKARLLSTIGAGRIKLQVDSLPDGDTKSIYKAEGITGAIWEHLASLSREGVKARAIVYCSYATHSDQPIDEATEMRCHLLSSRLKKMVTEYWADTV